MYQLIFQRSVEAMCITSDGGQFVEQNASNISLWGRTDEELKVEKLAFAPIFGLDVFQELILKADFHSQTEEHNGKTKDGRALSVSITFFKMASELKTYITFIQKEMSSLNMDPNLGEEVTVTKMKWSFVANVSHELRTPMNSIIGNSELLMDKVEDAEQKELISIIGQSGEALLSIINNVLDVSKWQSTTPSREESLFSLMEILDMSISVITLPLTQKGLKLNCQLSKGLPHSFVGDKNKIRQVLTNLLTNAVKFTPQGEITVSVELIEQSGTDCVLLWKVADTGIGISEEGVQLLFKPFSQLKQPSKVQEGTGLGLCICKSFVESVLGGKIWHTPTYPTGSSFQFTSQVQISEGLSKGSIYPYNEVSPLQGSRFFIGEMDYYDTNIVQWALQGWGATFTADSEENNLSGSIVDADYLQNGKSFNQLPSPVVVLEKEKLFRGPVSVKVVKKPRSFLKLFNSLRPQEKPTSSAAVQERRNSLRILIAEDNLVNQKVLRGLLHSLGFKSVDTVQNGLEALTQVENKKYDFIFMDLRMPLCDGFECTEKIRLNSNENISTIPIVGVTADATPESRNLGLKKGMTDLITKPFRKLQLERLVTQYACAGID